LNSVTFLLVGQIFQWLSFVEILKVLRELVNAIGHELFVLLSTVGSDQNVWKIPQLTLCVKWLNFEHIKDCTSDNAFFQSFSEILFVHCWSSTNIHKHSSFLHLGESRVHVEEFTCVSNFW